MSSLFSAGVDKTRLFLLTLAFSASSVAVYVSVRLRAVRERYYFMFPLIWVGPQELRFFFASLLVGLLGVHISAVLPSLVSRERLGRVNAERAIAGALGDFAGIAAALFIKEPWSLLAAPALALAGLMPKMEYERGEGVVLSVGVPLYLNAFLLGIAYSLTPATLALWARGESVPLALIYTAPSISRLIGGFTARRLLKGGWELETAILATLGMAAATGALGYTGEIAHGWALAFTRWFFMYLEGIAYSTFVQAKFKRELLPGIFTTINVSSEAGRLAGSFLVPLIISLSVRDAFLTSAALMAAAATALAPYLAYKTRR
ncbi:MAG: hypothetical protein QXP31_08430 [Pyrobaculum sp.]|uniref:hypothetical protein n=1 Tax=Pyrobaculum sp. TaxID=2004705 RepID=UPI003178D206